MKKIVKALALSRVKGFTLIELLIVIALLGALAAGLLAAIDPFEQLKKGADTSIRGQAETMYNATIAYYAQRNAMPTNLTTEVGGTGSFTNAAALIATISELAAAGELKADFYNLAGAGKLSSLVVSLPDEQHVVVCYQPQSKAFRNDQYTKYNNTGGTNIENGDTCPNGTSTACHLCFQ